MPATKNTFKKRLGLSILLSALLAAGSLLGVQAERYLSKRKQRQSYGRVFPVMDLLALNGKTYNTRQLAATSMNKLVVVFDPDCEHCQTEIHDLLRNADKFSGTSILFISPQPVQSLKPVEKEVNQTPSSNVLLFGIDLAQLFKSFPIRSFPEIYLYGKNNREISKYSGETPSTVLLSDLNK